MAALVLAAAVTLSGECGPLGVECELAVARTIANRMTDDRWPADLEAVLEGYYGKASPSATSLTLAYVLVTQPEALQDNVHYYAYSDADRARMGWRKGEDTVCKAGLCLHLSGTWMGR